MQEQFFTKGSMKAPISSDSPFYVRFGQIKISFNSIKFKSTKIYIYTYIFVKMFVRLFFQHRRNEGIQNTVEYILHASCLKYYSSYYLRSIFSLHESKSMRNVISSPSPSILSHFPANEALN